MLNTFGNRLSLLRQEKGLTQAEFAIKFNKTNSAISSYEVRGRFPDEKLLKEMALFFDVSLDYLMGTYDIKKATKEKNNQKEEVHSFTVSLVIELLNKNIISDPNNIPDEITDMIIAALKLDIKSKKETK